MNIKKEAEGSIDPKEALAIALSYDCKPIDLAAIKKRVARSVNIQMGIKDGGNINIARGRVLYDQDRLEKRKRVLDQPIE